MAFGAKLIADSYCASGVRLSSFEIEFPRYIQAEVNTHKMLSKNSASSRAIPVKKMLERLVADPYTPVYWGANKKGMQAGAELGEEDKARAMAEWLGAMENAMQHAEALREIGLHKQDANRILEPWMWQKVLITGTEWSNFFHLRNHPDAHPAFQTVAAMMQELYEELEPRRLSPSQWHLPYVSDEEFEAIEDWTRWVKISAGRCARTSNLTQDGVRDPDADVGLHDRLLGNGHMSPFEHQARPAQFADADMAMVKLSDVKITRKGEEQDGGGGVLHVLPSDQWHGNFRGWVQYRKTIPNEHDIMGTL